MTVAELIETLKTFPPDVRVAYQRCSEQCLLEADELRLSDHCVPRPDGWIQNIRPDMPQETYLMFPGN